MPTECKETGSEFNHSSVVGRRTKSVPYSVRRGGDCACRQVITFEGGVPGFPEARRFTLAIINSKNPFLMSLNSVDIAELGFVVLAFSKVPKPYMAEHIVQIEDAIGAEFDACALLGMTTLMMIGKSVEAFVNLRAPIVIDTHRCCGAQIVLSDASLPFRVSLGKVNETTFPNLRALGP